MIQVLSAKKYSQKLKVTIQATGKLGFSDETARTLRLSEGAAYVKFLKDGDTDVMYMSVLYAADEDAFKVCKAGTYYYLATAQLFNDLDIDYKHTTVIYDLVRCAQLDGEFGGAVYRMNPRILKRGGKNM